MGDEARRVGVVAAHPVALDDQRVHRPDRPCPLRQGIGEAEGRLLVRDGDVAAGKAGGRQPAQEGLESLRRHVDALVGAVDPVLGEPVPVDQGRAGMPDRVADDEGLAGHGFLPGTGA